MAVADVQSGHNVELRTERRDGVARTNRPYAMTYGVVGDHVRDREAAAGAEDPVRLGEHRGLVRLFPRQLDLARVAQE